MYLSEPKREDGHMPLKPYPKRTSRGRVATELSYKKLGLKAENRQPIEIILVRVNTDFS